MRGKLDHKNKLIEKKTQEALQVAYIWTRQRQSVS